MTQNFEWNITYDCNLACKWCTRLCGSKFNRPDHMSLEQVRRYALATAPLISAQSRINIVGGEPTLHPQILKC